MSQERRLPLLENLKRMNLDALTVANCQQARALLATCPPVEVIITDVTLADGNWRDIFKCLADHNILCQRSRELGAGGRELVVRDPVARRLRPAG